MNTDQIAADAANKLPIKTVGDLKLSIAIIKSVIEKAKLVGWKEGREHLRESLKHPVSRAAHASEHLLDQIEGARNCIRKHFYNQAELILNDVLSQRPTPATDDTKRLDAAFLRRMSAELYANDKRKGGWEDWRPTIQEVWSEITHHYNKLQQALLYNRDHQELCADLANLCMKLFSLPTPATASEVVPAGEVEGKYHGQFDMKPESASTGKALTPKQCAEQFRLYAKSHPSKDSQHSLRFCADFLDEYCVATPSDSASTGKQSWEEPIIGPSPCVECGGDYGEHRDGCSTMRPAATPSGVGEWTEETVTKIYATSMHPFRAIADARNAALRRNDTKRLDLMETQGSQFAKIKGKSWRESADIHAAMRKTGEQKVDWLRAAAGPTEEQQTGEQAK